MENERNLGLMYIRSVNGPDLGLDSVQIWHFYTNLSNFLDPDLDPLKIRIRVFKKWTGYNFSISDPPKTRIRI